MSDERSVSKSPRPRSKADARISWARGLSNAAVADILQHQLLDARASGASSVLLLAELVHEIKFRLARGKPSEE
jgi:hypothetical protein